MAEPIEQTVRIDAGPGVVFAALVTPDLVSKWLCHEAEVEGRPGGKFELRWSAQDRGATVRYDGAGEVIAYTPDELLAIRLAPGDGPSEDSVIRFELRPVDEATEVRLTQTGFRDDGDAARSRDLYSRGWATCLRALRSLIEDEPSERLVPALMSRDIPIPGQDPCGIAWDGESLWLSDGGRGRIDVLDPLRGRELGSIEFEGEPAGLAFDGESLWQADHQDRVLVKLDPATGRVTRRMKVTQVKGELTGITWDGHYLWLGDAGEFDGRVLRVHPRSGVVYGRIQVTPNVSGLAWDGSHLWVADFEARTLSQIEPRRGEVRRRVAVKGQPTGLAWDGDRLWYADSEWKLASRILDDLS